MRAALIVGTLLATLTLAPAAAPAAAQDESALLGTSAPGPLEVLANYQFIHVDRAVASESQSASRLWVWVGRVSWAHAVEVGVYADGSLALLGSCSIPQALPVADASWTSCELPEPIDVVAGNTYWLAVNHPTGAISLAAQPGRDCSARRTFRRFGFASLPDPFPMADSGCELGTDFAMFLGDGPPGDAPTG